MPAPERVVKGELVRIDFPDDKDHAILSGQVPFKYGRVVACLMEEVPGRQLYLRIIEDTAFESQVEMEAALARGKWSWRRFFLGFFGIPRSWSSEPSWTPPEAQ